MEGGVDWRVVVVKFLIVCDVGPDTMNSSFESLEHFHVKFGIERLYHEHGLNL